MVVSRGAGPCLLSGVQRSGWGQPASPPPRCCEWAWRPWLPSAPSCRSLRDSQGQLRPQARASVPVQAKQVAAASSRQRRGPLGVRPGSRPCVGGAVSISGAPLGAPGTSAGVCEGDSGKGGPGWKPELSGEPGMARQSGGGQGQRWSSPAGPVPRTGSHRCFLDRQAPGSVLVYLSEV